MSIIVSSSVFRSSDLRINEQSWFWIFVKHIRQVNIVCRTARTAEAEQYDHANEIENELQPLIQLSTFLLRKCSFQKLGTVLAANLKGSYFKSNCITSSSSFKLWTQKSTWKVSKKKNRLELGILFYKWEQWAGSATRTWRVERWVFSVSVSVSHNGSNPLPWPKPPCAGGFSGQHRRDLRKKSGKRSLASWRIVWCRSMVNIEIIRSYNVIFWRSGITTFPMEREFFFFRLIAMTGSRATQVAWECGGSGNQSRTRVYVW